MNKTPTELNLYAAGKFRCDEAPGAVAALADQELASAIVACRVNTKNVVRFRSTQVAESSPVSVTMEHADVYVRLL